MRSRAAFALAAGLIGVVAIAFVLLLPTIFLAAFQKSEAVRAVALENENQKHINLAADAEALESAGRLAGAVLGADANKFSPYLLFESIIRDAPPALRFDALQIRSDEKKIVIRGFAPTRSSLLVFIANLEKNPLIAGASSPVANLVKETDITFSISAAMR